MPRFCEAQTLNGDQQSAVQSGTRAVALCEQLEIQFDLAEAEMRLSDAYLHQHHYEQATYWLKKSLQTFYIFDKAILIGSNHGDLGLIAYKQQNYPLALQHLRQAIEIWHGAGYGWVQVVALVAIAQIRAEQQLYEEATRILAATLANLQPILSSIDEAPVLRNLLEQRMDPEKFAEIWVQGEALELNTLITDLLAELPVG